MSVKTDAPQEELKTLWLMNLEPNFRCEVSSQHGGEDVWRCIQCGTCSGACPVWRAAKGDDPQRVMKMTLLGMKREVLHSDFIWRCATCYTCAVRCPQGINFGDVTMVLRSLALKENIGPKYIKVAHKMIRGLDTSTN
jgi:heterodisulfide reductase subunit C